MTQHRQNYAKMFSYEFPMNFLGLNCPDKHKKFESLKENLRDATPPNGDATPWVPTTGTDDGFQTDNRYRRRVPPKGANNGTTTKWTNDSPMINV